jgi:uncharacterized protein DUF6084
MASSVGSTKPQGERLPDLSFAITGACVAPNAATPQLNFKLQITNAGPEPIHSVALRAQVQIEPVRRRYTSEEQQNLKELFGESERWSKSLHPLVWTNASLAVPSFQGSTLVELPVECTFDFNVAITKYIYGLKDGDLPLSMLFSGTIFYAGPTSLQVAQIPWDREANYRLPIRIWNDMMDSYYPNSAWICLRRDVFERLYEYKSRHGLTSWEQALERMLGMTAGAKA